jgi:hypothetical protein
MENYNGILCLTSGTNLIKLFTEVVFNHSKVLTSFCVIKQYYNSNYCIMAVNCHCKKFHNISYSVEIKIPW